MLRNLGDVVVWMPPFTLTHDDLVLLEGATARRDSRLHTVNGYFITGTGTGVGKTFIACELARCARDFGQASLRIQAHRDRVHASRAALVGSDQELFA